MFEWKILVKIIILALKVFVENTKKLSLADLKGKIELDEDYNYKKVKKSHVSD